MPAYVDEGRNVEGTGEGPDRRTFGRAVMAKAGATSTVRLHMS
jgi:hypothetical protein